MLKSKIFPFIALMLSLRSLLSGEALYEPCSLPDRVNYFINCFAERQKANKLTLVTKDGIGDCGLEKVALMFDYYGVLDLPTARRLILGVVTSFLQEINQEEKLRCFFPVFPLNLDEVSIQIRLRNDDCGFVYPYLGNIASISIIDGVITYGTINSYSYEVEALRRETYHQAGQLSTPR